MSQLKLDLSEMWLRLVARGSIKQTFTDVQGRPVETGVRMGPAGPEFYGIDVQTQREIASSVVEAAVDGCDFRKLYNPYRGLRAGGVKRGAKLGRQPCIAPDPDACRFFCQNPEESLSLLRRESVLQIQMQHFRWIAFPNAAPLDKLGHFLWVPSRSSGMVTVLPHLTQVLTKPLLEDFLSLAAASVDSVFFYNSLHAGATVNHIHFQSSYCTERLAVQDAKRRYLGKCALLEGYPAGGVAFGIDASGALWECIDALQRAGVPFNLFWAAGETYLLARNIEHELTSEFPATVLAALELAGKLTFTDEERFREIAYGDIDSAFRKTCLSAESVAAICGWTL